MPLSLLFLAIRDFIFQITLSKIVCLSQQLRISDLMNVHINAHMKDHLNFHMNILEKGFLVYINFHINVHMNMSI